MLDENDLEAVNERGRRGGGGGGASGSDGPALTCSMQMPHGPFLEMNVD